MENKLFTDARRLKYILDMCKPYDNPKCCEDSITHALIGDTNRGELMEMALKSEELGFDSLAIFNNSSWYFITIKKVIEEYNLKVVYLANRSTDFLEDLTEYIDMGFRMDCLVDYKASRTTTRKALRLVR